MIFRFRSLQQRFGVYAFILSFVPMLAVSILTYRESRQEVSKERGELMKSLAREIGDRLTVELNEASHDLELWGHLEFLHSSMAPDKQKAIIRFFDDLMDHHDKYDLICALTPDGHIFAVNTVNHIKTSIPSESLLKQSWKSLFPKDLPQDWFESLLHQTGVQGVGWRPIQAVNEIYARATGKSDTEALYQIALAMPIKAPNEETPMGALITVLNWSHFQKRLDAARATLENLKLDTGYAFLLAADGDMIIGHKYRDDNARTGNLYGKSVRRDFGLSELADRAKNDPQGTIEYDFRGKKVAALLMVNPGDLGPEFQWRLGVGINESDIYAPTLKLRNYFMLIASAFVLSVLVLSLILARRLSVSLGDLTQFVREAAEGRTSQLAPARTDDEIGKLGQAFNEMLVSFRSRLPFTPIPNPYVVGNPIRASGMFFGREEDLRWVGQHLDREGNEMILLFGPRRIGKTSLLHQIAKGRATRRALPFFFDTQQIIPELTSDADFYHLITREMLRQLSSLLPGVSPPFIADEHYRASTLRRLLEFLDKSAGDRTPVLLFDEFENLEYRLSSGALTEDVLLFLGGLLDGETKVSLVATGSDQLENLRSAGWRLLIPKTIPRRIGLLTMDDSLRLIHEPVRGYLFYGDGVEERILRTTAGHPYYTQVICQALVDYLNQKREVRADLLHYQEAVDLVLDNPPPPLSHVWDVLPPTSRIAAAGLAHVLVEDDSFSPAEAVLEGMPPELRSMIGDPVAFRSGLDSLCNDDWLERRDRAGYRFRIDLFRLWLRRDHSVWQVADEITRGPSG